MNKKILYTVLLLIAIVVVLIYTKGILIPLILAVLLWFIIKELKEAIDKIPLGIHLPSWLSTLLSFIIILTCIMLTVEAAIISTEEFITVLPDYQKNLEVFMKQIGGVVHINIDGWINDSIKKINIQSLLQTALSEVSSLLSNGVMVILYLLFIMIEAKVFRPKLKQMFPQKSQYEKIITFINGIDRSIGHYFSLKILVSLATSILSYIVLELIGVDFALFSAMLIFILNFIPSIGSLLATIFPVTIALMQFGTLQPALWVLACIGVIQFFIGNIIEPKVFGDKLNISGLTVILALTVWEALWGITGMILSVPLTVIILAILRQSSETKNVAIFLEGYRKRR